MKWRGQAGLYLTILMGRRYSTAFADLLLPFSFCWSCCFILGLFSWTALLEHLMIPVHTKWKIDQCTCSMSGISGRHLFYFSVKCAQLTRSVYVPFLSKKKEEWYSAQLKNLNSKDFPERTQVWIQFTSTFVPQTH